MIVASNDSDGFLPKRPLPASVPAVRNVGPRQSIDRLRGVVGPLRHPRCVHQVDTDVLPRPRPWDGRAVLPPVQEAAVFLPFRPAPLIAAMGRRRTEKRARRCSRATGRGTGVLARLAYVGMFQVSPHIAHDGPVQIGLFDVGSYRGSHIDYFWVQKNMVENESLLFEMSTTG